MRSITSILVLALTGFAFGQLVKPPLNPASFEVGQIGPLPGAMIYRVDSVLSKTSAVVVPTSRATPGMQITDARGTRIVGAEPEKDGRPFILERVDASGWADGKKIDPRGFYKVTGTKKIGRGTLYVLELQQ